MTKMIFKGAAEYRYVVDVQDYKLANIVLRNVFQ